MILYTLGCNGGHRFETWFSDSATYDEQAAGGYVTCPICGSTAVEKTIMAPALVSSRSVRREEAPMPAAVSADAPPSGDALLGERETKMRALFRSMRDKILSEGHDVGPAFPQEARRMHDGEVPSRPIHGQATPREARDLLEEGIMILPVPVLPEELN